MKVNDLLDYTLRDLLESYCAIYNPECGYYYGIASFDDVDEIFGAYNVSEYSEGFDVENLINDEILVSFDEELLSYERLERIMSNLDISKKKLPKNNSD